MSTRLCFDNGKLLRDIPYDDGLCFENGKLFSDDEPEYLSIILSYEKEFVNWVNHVLNVHQGTTVNHFKVFFSLTSRSSSVIDIWVQFAIKKRVGNLHLNFTSMFGCAPLYPCVFPSPEKLKLSTDHRLDHLKILRLVFVEVSEQVIHHFLKNCSLLEELCLVGSRSTSNLKIDGTESLKLKHLDLYHCEPMKNLEIYAPNLVSFSYTGPEKEVPFRNTPLLSELFLGDKYCDSFISEAPKHLSYLSQLIKLTLAFSDWTMLHWRYGETFPKLNNLKQLELRVGILSNVPLTWLTYLIEAAPILAKCVIKLAFVGTFEEFEHEDFCHETYKGNRKTYSHRWLQEIEIVGFVGHWSDFELAVDLITRSDVLDKITINTRHPGSMFGPNSFSEAFVHREPSHGAERVQGTKIIADKLRPHVPPGAQFLII